MNLKPWFLKFSTLALTIILSLTIFSLPASAYDRVQLDQLIETRQCSGCDLSGATFYNADLRDANLQGANLTGANLERAELNRANLENAELRDATLQDAILVDANLSAADFSNATMQGANLKDANLEEAKLCDTFLFEATMPNNTTYLEGVTDLSDYKVELNCEKSSVSSEEDSSLLSPVSCTVDPSPINFEQKVTLGITPTGWSNSDDLTIDTNPRISYQQILSEIALSGFYGTQGAPKFPSKEELKTELDRRGLTISEPWVGTYFTLGEKGIEESKRIFNEQIKFMDGFDSQVIVVAELGGAVHQEPIDPIKNEPVFDEDQKKALYDGLKELAQKAKDKEYILAYHPHVGTGVATIEQIEELMQETAGSPLGLLLDTGHVYYVAYGHDPNLTEDDIQEKIEGLTNTYKDRIKHVHLKNIRQDKLAASIANGTSFLNSIRAGVFTVPGDEEEGAIKFNPILETLAEADYEGWLIVEAEQDPNTTMGYNPPKTPLDYALMAREYLCENTGL